VIVSVNVIGGVRRDLESEQGHWVLAQLNEVEQAIQQLKATILEDYTVKKRTVGKGILTRQQAYELGAVGPTARGSGVATDIRQTRYGAYADLDFEPVMEADGDCYARSKVRLRETLASIALIRQVIARMPDGEIKAKIKAKGNPQGETVCRVEQPRGELCTILKAQAKSALTACASARPRLPTFQRFWSCCPGIFCPTSRWSPCPSTPASVAPNGRGGHPMFTMTPNILRNLLTPKATRRYPAQVQAPFENVRGELFNEIERCVLCGVCAGKCPSQCIEVDKQASLWIYDPFACIYCGVCVDACPAKCLYQKPLYRQPVSERLIIRLQGPPRKKGKGKEKVLEKEPPPSGQAEKESPVEPQTRNLRSNIWTAPAHFTDPMRTRFKRKQDPIFCRSPHPSQKLAP